MNSNDNSLATLQECKRGIDQLTAVLDANQKLMDHYNQVDLVEYKTYSNDYDARNKNFKNNLDEWQTKYKNEKDSYNLVRVNGSCNPAWFCANSNCPTGYTDDGTVTGSHGNCNVPGFGETGCAKSCQPDETKVNVHMNLWESGLITFFGKIPPNPKPTFTEIKKPTPTVPGINTTPIQINCCANISTVVGSTVSDTQLTQINKCSEEVNNKLSEPTTTATPTTAATLTTAMTPAKQDTRKIVLILAIFLVFFSSISSILLIQ